jgi:pimeloyl-ACP methyl ester carboxylesterase
MTTSRRTYYLIAAATVIALLSPVVLHALRTPRSVQVPFELDAVPFDGGTHQLGFIRASKPSSSKDRTLVVYLHGLGQSYLEPFTCPVKYPFAMVVKERFPNLIFSSCEFGTAHVWCHDKDFSDITHSIDHLVRIFSPEKIIMAGSSMGGSAALTYAAIAPIEIRKKICGVLSIYPAGDFAKLHDITLEPVVKLALEKGFKGTPQTTRTRYLDSSVLSHLDTFPREAKVYVVSALKDTVSPTELQNELITALGADAISVQSETFNGTHMQTPPSECFARGLNFILSTNR